MDVETVGSIAVKLWEIVEYHLEKVFSTLYLFRRAHEALEWALNLFHKKYM
jgi:hypothetical protein